MNVTTAPIVHAVRTSVLENEVVWRLGPDALECARGADPAAEVTARYPYGTITEMRLSYDPTRVDSSRYRCELRLSTGAAAAIRSTHYRGIADFEDRSATYVPFVRGLAVRVAAANPACRFWAGKRPFAYWAEHLFLLAMILLLVLVLGLVGGLSLGTLVWIKLGILAGFVPIMILYTRKNWPRRLDPAAITPEVLPDVAR
jgi:hypothetical protein